MAVPVVGDIVMHAGNQLIERDGFGCRHVGQDVPKCIFEPDARDRPAEPQGVRVRHEGAWFMNEFGPEQARNPSMTSDKCLFSFLLSLKSAL